MHLLYRIRRIAPAGEWFKGKPVRPSPPGRIPRYEMDAPVGAMGHNQPDPADQQLCILIQIILRNCNFLGSWSAVRQGRLPAAAGHAVAPQQRQQRLCQTPSRQTRYGICLAIRWAWLTRNRKHFRRGRKCAKITAFESRGIRYRGRRSQRTECTPQWRRMTCGADIDVFTSPSGLYNHSQGA